MPTSEMAGNTQAFANAGPDADTQEVQADVAAYNAIPTQAFANSGPDADTQEVQADVAAYYASLGRKLPSLRAGESMCATYSAPCVAWSALLDRLIFDITVSLWTSPAERAEPQHQS
jgi:hypothetical protein